MIPTSIASKPLIRLIGLTSSHRTAVRIEVPSSRVGYLIRKDSRIVIDANQLGREMLFRVVRAWQKLSETKTWSGETVGRFSFLNLGVLQNEGLLRYTCRSA
jgi:hypothetical protein